MLEFKLDLSEEQLELLSNNMKHLVIAAQQNHIGDMWESFNNNSGFEPNDQAPFFQAIINELARINLITAYLLQNNK